MFQKTGILQYPVGSDEDAIMEVALEAGADDVIIQADGSIEVQASVEDFMSVKETMEASGMQAESAEVIQKPDTETEVDIEDAQKIMRLIDMLEDLDDVQEVHSNADFSDDVMAQLSE